MDILIKGAEDAAHAQQAFYAARRFVEDYPDRKGGRGHGVTVVKRTGCLLAFYVYWTPCRRVTVLCEAVTEPCSTGS